MANLIRIQSTNGAIFIDGYPVPIPVGSLQASLSGSAITVGNIKGGSPLLQADFTALGDQDGNPFASATAAMAYLEPTLARLPSPAPDAGPYQDVLDIVEQNVIPPLTFAFAASPGAFANIIVGAATFVNGRGVVRFADGSNLVTFDPFAAGFNLNPNDQVIAQYSTQQGATT